jgi:hypothetical protein
MKEKVSLDLQVHLFLDKYSPETVIKAMQKNNLDGIAIERYNLETDNFSKFLEYKDIMKNKGYEIENDDILIKIKDTKNNNEFFGFNSQEVSTSDEYHILIYGCNKIIQHQTIKKTIDKALNKGAFVAIDHPFVDVNDMKKPITKEKIKELEKVCKEYEGKIALEWNGYCINWIWDVLKLKYGINANEEVLRFSDRLKNEGYNVPVFTDTDVHARNKLGLSAIGTSRILIPEKNLDLSSGSKFIYSLNDCILNEKHENTYRTADIFHFTFYFAIPQLFQKYFNRVRG